MKLFTGKSRQDSGGSLSSRPKSTLDVLSSVPMAVSRSKNTAEFLHVVDEMSPTVVKAIFRYDSVSSLSLSQLRFRIQLALQSSELQEATSAPNSQYSDAETISISGSDHGSNLHKQLFESSDSGDEMGRSVSIRRSVLLTGRRASKASIVSQSAPSTAVSESESFVSQAMPFLFVGAKSTIRFLHEEHVKVRSIITIDRSIARISLKSVGKLWSVLRVENGNLDNNYLFLTETQNVYPFDDDDSLKSARNRLNIKRLDAEITNVNEFHLNEVISNPESMTLREFLIHSRIESSPNFGNIYVQIEPKISNNSVVLPNISWTLRVLQREPGAGIVGISSEIERLSGILESTDSISSKSRSLSTLNEFTTLLINILESVSKVDESNYNEFQPISLSNWPPPPVSVPFGSNEFSLTKPEILSKLISSFLTISFLIYEAIMKFVLPIISSEIDLNKMAGLLDFLDEIKLTDADSKLVRISENIPKILSALNESLIFIQFSEPNPVDISSNISAIGQNTDDKISSSTWISEAKQFWHVNGFGIVEPTYVFFNAVRLHILRQIYPSERMNINHESLNTNILTVDQLRTALDDNVIWERVVDKLSRIVDRNAVGLISVSDFEYWVSSHSGLIFAVEETVKLVYLLKEIKITQEEMELKELKSWLDPISMHDDLLSYLENTPTTALEHSSPSSIQSVVEIIRKECEGNKRVLVWQSLAGSGKSTTIANLVKHTSVEGHLLSPLSALTDGTQSCQVNIAGYFFFSADTKLQNGIDKVAHTLAFQFAQKNSDFRKALFSLMQTKKASNDPNDHQIVFHGLNNAFRTLIVEPFEMLFIGKTIPTDIRILFILDGLDECALYRDKVAILSLIRIECARLPPHVRFLLTSRSDDDLNLQILPKTLYSEITLNEKIIKADLRKFAEVTLGKDLLIGNGTISGTAFISRHASGAARRGQIGIINQKSLENEFDAAIDLLVSKSDGVALWLHIALEILVAQVSSNSDGGNKRTNLSPEDVQALPRGIDGLLRKLSSISISRLNTSTSSIPVSTIGWYRNSNIDEQILQLKLESFKDRPDINELIRLINKLPGPDTTQSQRRLSVFSGNGGNFSTSSTAGEDVDIRQSNSNNSRLELAKLILLTVNALEEPLTIDALAVLIERSRSFVHDVAFSLTVGSSGLKSGKFATTSAFGAVAKGVGLLKIDQDTKIVRIANKTISEFLRDEERCENISLTSYFLQSHEDEKKLFTIYEDPRSRHLILAQRCIEIMKSELTKDPCGLGLSTENSLAPQNGISVHAATVVDREIIDIEKLTEEKILLSLRYACKHLVTHLRKSININRSAAIRRGRQRKNRKRAAQSRNTLGTSSTWFIDDAAIAAAAEDYHVDESGTEDIYQFQLYGHEEDEELYEDHDWGIDDEDTENEMDSGDIFAIASTTSPPRPIPPVLVPTMGRASSNSGSGVSNTSSVGSHRASVAMALSSSNRGQNGVVSTINQTSPADIYKTNPSILIDLLNLISTTKFLNWLEILHLLSPSQGGGTQVALKALRYLRRRWIPTDEMLDSIVTSTGGVSSSTTSFFSAGFGTPGSLFSSMTAGKQHLGISHFGRKSSLLPPSSPGASSFLSPSKDSAQLVLLEDFPSYRRRVVLARQLMYDTERTIMELGHFFVRFPVEIYRWAGIFVPEDTVFRRVFFPHVKEINQITQSLFMPFEDSSTISGSQLAENVRVLRGRRSGGWNSDLLTLKGHKAPVTVVACSPSDFRRCITAGEEGVARVWDLESGECVARLDASWWAGPGDLVPSKIKCVAFCPENTRKVVVAGDDDRMRIWHAETGELLFTLTPPSSNNDVDYGEFSDNATTIRASQKLEHDLGVTCISFFPGSNKRLFVSGHKNGVAHVWDSLLGRHIQTLDNHGHTMAIVCVAISKSYGQSCEVATGSEDGNTIVWNPETGEALRHLTGHIGSVLCLAFSPHEWWRLLTGSLDKSLKIWDAGSGKCMRTLTGHKSQITHLAFVSPTRGDNSGPSISHKLTQIAATASSDGEFRIWNVQVGDCVHVIKAHDGPITGISFLPTIGECWFLTSGMEGISKLWNIQNKAKENNNLVQENELDSDDSDDAEVDEEVCECIHIFSKHYREIRGFALSSDGRRMVTVSADHTAKLWDVESSRLAASRKLSASFIPPNSTSKSGIVFPPLQKGSITKNQSANDDEDGHKDWVLCVGTQQKSINESPLNLFVTGSMDNTAKVWNATTTKLVATLRGHRGWIRCAAFSPHDPYLVVTGSADSTAGVWVIDNSSEINGNATCIQVLSGHTAHINCLTFSAIDSLCVATGALDGSVRVWDLGRGECKRIFQNDSDDEHQLRTILCVAFGPNHKNSNAEKTLFAAGGPDGCIRGWNIETGECTISLIGHKGPVTTIAFSDTTDEFLRVATGGHDGTARIWHVTTGELLKSIKVSNSTVTFVSFAVTNKNLLITGGTDRLAKVWDLEKTGQIDPINILRGQITKSTISSSFSKANAWFVIRDGHKISLWDGIDLIDAGFVAEDETSDVVIPVTCWENSDSFEGQTALIMRLWWFKRGKPVCYEFVNSHNF
ncbi:WD repeat-containing protein 26 [Nowakowskiella sp. JEL0078]|nr:WD repeat-containing protein 26 [Nowakowskiella sp. JEL0078]